MIVQDSYSKAAKVKAVPLNENNMRKAFVFNRVDYDRFFAYGGV